MESSEIGMMMSTNAVAVVLLGALASGWDIRTRRIPNAITLGFPIAAVATHLAAQGWPALATTGAGWLVGLILFLPLFLLGGMGAGDVKLLAAFGAWVGPWNAVETALAASLIGGVLAVAVALSRSYGKQMLVNISQLLWFWRTEGVRAHPTLTLEHHAGPRLAYAIPISVGAMVSLWLQ